MRARLLLLVGSLIIACKGNIGDLCTEDADCQSDQCGVRFDSYVSQCIADCGADSDCPGSSECRIYVCSVPCSTDEECPAGTVCDEPLINGDGPVCMAACESNDDCMGATPVCDAGRCTYAD
ncbi:MAG: hypothetical protein H6729_00080 [Deltaproteobacteria bacterium]|nr:hypothetical protein [Deltaproteobacteria bacterium]